MGQFAAYGRRRAPAQQRLHASPYQFPRGPLRSPTTNAATNQKHLFVDPEYLARGKFPHAKGMRFRRQRCDDAKNRLDIRDRQKATRFEEPANVPEERGSGLF